MFRSALAPLPPRLFSSTAARRTEAFADLARITGSGSGSSSSAAPPSSFVPPSPVAAPSPAEARGYAIGAMPAKKDPVLELFTNLLMDDGKKVVAQRHVANILGMVQRATNQPPVPQLKRAIELAAPQVQVITFKHFNKTHFSPRALTERQRYHRGIKAIFKAAERGRKGAIRRDDRIAREILAVLEGTSETYKRLEEGHRIAMLNRSNIFMQ